MKFAICLAFCLFVASFAQPTPNEQALQNLYNGFFEKGGLPDPTTILSCYDDSSATLTVNFIGKILQQLDNYDVFDIQSTVTAFQNALPQSVKDCTNSNAEYQAAQNAYHIAGLTMAQLTSKVGSYAFAHLSALHSQADSANKDFKAGNYNNVGQTGGALAQSIFGSGLVGDDESDLQLMANGFWENAGLNDPTTFITCFDANSANITVTFFGNVLSALANSNVKAAEAALETFESTLPNNTKACLTQDAETQQVLQAYNIFGLTVQELESKVESYAVWHLIQLHKDASIANSDFQAGNFKTVGQEGGIILRSVFGKNSSESVESVGDDESDLQLMANGFWENAGLGDPTTFISCFDANSANITVTFLGNVLSALANSNVKAAEAALETFESTLPNATKDCLAGNAETQQVLQAYNIFGLSVQELESKVESYAVWHLIQLHKDASIANSDFQAGNFKTVGQEGGIILRSVFGKNSSVAVGDDQENLQLLADGYWEYAGLADPTTLNTCFDESTATLTVNFIGSLLGALASSNINAAESALNDFENNFPNSTRDCLAANAEMQQVLQTYNMYGLTIQQLESKIETYALFHLIQVHNDATKAYGDFQAGNFKTVGSEGGAMVQNVFGKNSSESVESVGDDESDLQLMANGFWENAGLNDPTTFITCFDANSANITVTFFGNVLSALANSNVKAAEAALETFESTLPNNTKACLTQDAETQQVLQAYNIYGLTVQELESKVESYAVWHLIQLHKDASIANSDFQAGNFKTVGQEGGIILRSVFGKNSSVAAITDDPLQDLTQMFDGFWEQANEADPTSAVACFDEPNAQITVTFAGQVFSDLASDNLLNLPSAVSTFKSQLSPSVISCLSADPEVNQIGQAYGISGVSTATLIAKIGKYALLHGIAFQQSANALNQDFTSGQYDATGKLAGQLLQSIMSGSQYLRYNKN